MFNVNDFKWDRLKDLYNKAGLSERRFRTSMKEGKASTAYSKPQACSNFSLGIP